MSEPGQKVEVQYRWLLLLLSVGVLFLLREHKVLLSVYVGLVFVGLGLYVFWLPRRVEQAQNRFGRESLRLLAADDYEGLRALAARQWLIRRFGQRHVVPEKLALAASAAGEHEAARTLYLEALRHAPPEERTRVELNLARAEVASGHLDRAEGRFRAILSRRPRMALALTGLGRLLLEKGEDLDEAADLLERALEVCDPREVASLEADVEAARAQARARSHSETRG